MGNERIFDVLDDIYSSTVDLSKWENVLIGSQDSNIDILGQKLEALVDSGSRDLLSSHFIAAARISQALSSQSSELSAIEQILEFFFHAMFILDGRGRIMRMNNQAAQIEDGLNLSDSVIKISNQDDDDKFQKTLHQAMAFRSVDSNCGEEIISLSRPSGKSPYRVFISPLPPSQLFLIFSEPALVLIIVDPDENLDYLKLAVRETYGLSRRETELTIRLMSGLTLPKAASAMSIAYETARTMIKRIFKKTGCHSQTELVKLVLSLPK